MRDSSRAAAPITRRLVGYGSALLFLFAGAPNLAFTQFVVESVPVMLATSLLPFLHPDGPPPGRSRALGSALAVGLATFALLAPWRGCPSRGA